MLFTILFMVLEAILRVSIWKATPHGPRFNLETEWVQYVLLPILIACVFIAFPVDEEKVPFRAVLITIASYWSYLTVMVFVLAPRSYQPVMHSIVVYGLISGVMACLASVGAKRRLVAMDTAESRA